MRKGGRARLDMLSNAEDSYSLCLQAAAQMKLEGVHPDVQVYRTLMRSASHSAAWLHAWAILDDMLLMGIKPDVAMFNSLIHAHRHRPSPLLWKIFDKMNELDVQPNSTTYTHLISLYTTDGNLEVALHYFYEMKSRGLAPQSKATQKIILLASKLGYPRLAIDIAAWHESLFVEQLELSVWLNCLAASAHECYVDGVVHCWKIVTETFNITPDEGVCVAVLQTAARHGLPDLAMDVLRVIKSAGIKWQEYHFASIVDAFCRSSQVKEALTTLNLMRSNKTPPTSRTTRPILDLISASTDVLDNAWQIIEEIQKEYKKVDTAALNILIQASVHFDDLQRAMDSYKSFSEYNASPDVETFNALLEGCVASKHRQLGDMLLDDMKAAKVKPNADTFQQMISLCLSQETYEDAFFYLEEMKAAGHVPPVTVYCKIVRRCVSVNDARYRMALEEMEDIGYAIPVSLKKDIKEYTHGSSHQVPVEDPGVQQAVRLDGAAQRYVETGGL
ncbi:hypothetical protein APHAL10511_007266 [Amanita phalloides]|nr:hypothetical protein APHAL10511_007266 [Amanita phalloides]